MKKLVSVVTVLTVLGLVLAAQPVLASDAGQVSLMRVTIGEDSGSGLARTDADATLVLAREHPFQTCCCATVAPNQVGGGCVSAMCEPGQSALCSCTPKGLKVECK